MEKTNKLLNERSMVEDRLDRLGLFISTFNPVTQFLDDLEIRMEILSEIHSESSRLCREIQEEVNIGDENNRKNLSTIFGDFNDKFCYVKSAYRRQISVMKEKVVEQSSSNTSHQANRSQVFKLPPVPIPQFTGDVKDWIGFRDSFDALVNHDSMQDITKLHYLREALKNGGAWKLISEVKIAGDSFEVAWEILKKRFNNSRVIIDSHLTQLFKLKPVSGGSAAELWQLIEECDKQLKALKALEVPVDHWDTIIVHMIKYRLDEITRKDWELESMKLPQLPKWTDLEEFLSQRCRVLESIESTNKKKTTFYKGKPTFDEKTKFKGNSDTRTNAFACNTSSNEEKRCLFCDNSHSIQECRKFAAKQWPEKQIFIKTNGLCFKCLVKGHLSSNCEEKCSNCGGGHHLSIHKSNEKKPEPERKPNPENTIVNVGNLGASKNLLMTAVIRVKDHNGEWIQARALLDGGSMSNLVTDRFVNKLKLPQKAVDVKIDGIWGSSGTLIKSIAAEIGSRTCDYQKNVKFLTIPEILSQTPLKRFASNQLQVPNYIKENLADKKFGEPGPVDILIGVGVFLDSLEMEQIRLGEQLPILQKTKFGWVVGGDETDKVLSSQVLTTATLENDLKRFWEIENDLNQKRLSIEEEYCEQHFVNNFQRNKDGRYTVKIPFNIEVLKQLGDSKATAIRRFLSTEKRLAKDPQLKADYCKFMNEYESLGHMSEVDEPRLMPFYIMPHHPVFKPDSTTTKLRVVFNASEKTSTGVSVNEAQYTGPVIQRDLFSIILKIRKYPIAFSADSEKMYRMIEVDKTDRKYQLIIWRNNSDDKLRYYELNTCTYGYTSASFLSTRVMKQLADDERQRFPLASQALEDFYFDDFAGGAETVEDALKLRNQLIEMFKSGGMKLRKWSSNCAEALSGLSSDYLENDGELSINNSIKSLGIKWYNIPDQYGFETHEDLLANVHTKRQLLSQILKLFDPLGYLSPVIVIARLLIQELWLLKLDWDDKMPQTIIDRWQIYAKDLQGMKDIRIKRCVKPHGTKKIELHGFSDSSEKAYGACCYLKVTDVNGESEVNLLCSKFRVAPLKKKTLPQLELCGAVLLCRLMKKVIEAMKLEYDEIFMWTDSTIVLSWLQTPPYKLKTFEANRISEIQEAGHKFLHVPSKSNPADLLTRGLTVAELKESRLWWSGPEFLQDSSQHWPKIPKCLSLIELPGTKPQEIHVFASQIDDFDVVIQNYSSVLKLQRHIAYWNRFIHNKYAKNSDKMTGFLTVKELSNSLKAIVRMQQKQHFPKEYRKLRDGQEVNADSTIKSLNPFIDAEGIIRVGGRLKHSSLPYDSRHQILLPKNSHFTEILIVEQHKLNAHVGPQALLSILRQKFWPVHGKQLIRRLLHGCVKCTKLKAKNLEQFMGDLPTERIEFVHPFFITGVDYAGYFLIKEGGIRSQKFMKAYVAVFVCMVTRAVHLEVALDLTSLAFLQALARFVARRGKPKQLMSDNGTNFVGGNREMKEIYQSLSDNYEDIDRYCADNGIQWQFIPPRSPSMGGEWEAAVKSFKFHLNRIVGNAKLTLGEFCTVLCKIEAILNSRPLFEESADPNDLSVVTPGHFLIGRPLTAIAEVDWKDTNVNRLTRYQRVQQATQHFWKRFNKEYLNNLQVRKKLFRKVEHIAVGQLVVIKDENAKPLNWEMARIIQIHPGQDKVVRVVTVKTQHGIYKRAVNRLCILPVEPVLLQGEDNVE